MKYAGINKNDMSAAPGVSVTVFTQGCPHRCKGCHNPETWDFNGGKEFNFDTLNEIERALVDNNITRALSIMGGEPLCQENIFLVKLLLSHLKSRIHELQVYIWTGYIYEDLVSANNGDLNYILSTADYLIDGPYMEKYRDVTLHMRGSSNQRVIDLHTKQEVDLSKSE